MLRSFSRKATFVLAGVALTACSGYGGVPNARNVWESNGATATVGLVVKMAQSSYQPAKFSVKAGTIVKFLNKDSLAHTVTANDGSFGSSLLSKGDAWVHKFGKPGKFYFHCKIHTFMTGTVTVTN